MKKINIQPIVFIGSFLLFLISINAQQNALPNSSLLKSQSINGFKSYLDFFAFADTKMNNEYVYSIVEMQDSVWVDSEIEKSYQVNPNSWKEVVLFQFDKQLEVVNKIQLWSSNLVKVYSLNVFDNEIWISGRIFGDSLHFSNKTIESLGDNCGFHLCLDKNLNYKTHYVVLNGGNSLIKKDEDITYISAYLNNENMLIINQDTFNIPQNSIVLAIRDGDIIWKKVIDNTEIIKIDVLPEKKLLVVGKSDQKVTIDDKLVFSKEGEENYYFTSIFDKNGNLSWYVPDLPFWDVNFSGPNTLYFKDNYHEEDTLVVLDSTLYSNAASGNLGYMGMMNTETNKLIWLEQVKGDYFYLNKSILKDNLFAIIGEYGYNSDLLIGAQQFDTSEYVKSFLYVKSSNNMEAYSIQSTYDLKINMLDIEDKELLVGGVFSGELFEDENRLDENIRGSLFIALINRNKLVGVKNYTKYEKKLKVYPNPIQPSKSIQISSKNNEEILNLRLFDNLGKVISKGKGGNFKIPNSLKAGVYYLGIEMENEVEVHKLMVGM